MSDLLALIPARSGSLRVPNKNLRPFGGHPLLAYSVWQARHAGIFERIVVSTDSEEIAAVAQHYGAEVPFLRPAAMGTALSPDIEWVTHALGEVAGTARHFAILRPTSPFRTPATIVRAYQWFLDLGSAVDSLRAVSLCTEHPYKMWRLGSEDGRMEPLFRTPDHEVPYHSRPYQGLPQVYVQDSSLEIAHVSIVVEQHSISGRRIAPFISQDHEGFSIDHPIDWILAEHLVDTGAASLVEIPLPPYSAGR